MGDSVQENIDIANAQLAAERQALIDNPPPPKTPEQIAREAKEHQEAVAIIDANLRAENAQLAAERAERERNPRPPTPVSEILAARARIDANIAEENRQLAAQRAGKTPSGR